MKPAIYVTIFPFGLTADHELVVRIGFSPDLPEDQPVPDALKDWPTTVAKFIDGTTANHGDDGAKINGCRLKRASNDLWSLAKFHAIFGIGDHNAASVGKHPLKDASPKMFHRWGDSFGRTTNSHASSSNRAGSSSRSRLEDVVGAVNCARFGRAIDKKLGNRHTDVTKSFVKARVPAGGSSDPYENLQRAYQDLRTNFQNLNPYLTKEKQHKGPDLAKPSRSAKQIADEYNEFHTIWGSVYDRPALALRCGVLVDCVVSGLVHLPSSVELSYLPPIPGISVGSLPVTLNAEGYPTTKAIVDTNNIPLLSWTLANGFLPFGDTENVSVAITDSASDVIKLVNAAENANPADPTNSHESRPGRKSAIYVSVPDTSDFLQVESADQDQLYKASTVGPSITLDGNYLVKGYAVYCRYLPYPEGHWAGPVLVSADINTYQVYSGEMASLSQDPESSALTHAAGFGPTAQVSSEEIVHERRIDHRFRNRADDFRDISVTNQGGAGADKDNHYISDVLFSYLGKPMGLPILGQGVDVTKPANSRGDLSSSVFRLNTITSSDLKYVPLRYGWKYRFAAHAHTAAGTPISDAHRHLADEHIWSLETPLFRSHPVGSPIVGVPFRAYDYQSESQVVAYGDEPNRQPSVARLRWILPPRTDADDLMRHGVLDRALLDHADTPVDERSLRLEGHSPGSFRLNYTPDPAANGIRFSIPWGDQTVTRFVSFYPGDHWPHWKPILLELLPGSDINALPTIAPPEHHETYTKVSITTPPASIADLTLAVQPVNPFHTRPQDGACCQFLGEYFHFVSQLNMTHEEYHQMVLHAEEPLAGSVQIKLIHAVRNAIKDAPPAQIYARRLNEANTQPLGPQSLDLFIRPPRRYRDTSVKLQYQGGYLARSVQQMNLMAKWNDPGPFKTPTHATFCPPQEIQGQSLPYSDGPGAPILICQYTQDFRDTKFRDVFYQPVPVCRFATYYTAPQTQLTRMNITFDKDPEVIKNTGILEHLKKANPYLPALRFLSTDIPAPLEIASMSRVRRRYEKHGQVNFETAVRLEFSSPWHTSGTDEGIAFILSKSSQPIDPEGFLPTVFTQYVTRCARDILSDYVLDDSTDPQLDWNQPVNNVQETHIGDGVLPVGWINLQMTDGSYAVAQLLTFDQFFLNEEGTRWVVHLNTSGLTRDFLDMTFARYQPYSIQIDEGQDVIQPYALSKVSFPEQIPIRARRTFEVNIDRHDHHKVHINVVSPQRFEGGTVFVICAFKKVHAATGTRFMAVPVVHQYGLTMETDYSVRLDAKSGQLNPVRFEEPIARLLLIERELFVGEDGSGVYRTIDQYEFNVISELVTAEAY